MRKLRKKILRNVIIQLIIELISVIYMFFIKLTSTLNHRNSDSIKKSWDGDEQVIIAFWHNRLLLMTHCWKSNYPFHMLISKHPDGRLISKIINWFGISSINGSSTSGGGNAIRQLIRQLKNGSSIGITPDGPSGPIYKVNSGSIALAQLSGAKIIPVSASINHKRIISSWDKLIFPYPFSNIVCVWGEPIMIARNCNKKDILTSIKELEIKLNALSEEADILVKNETKNGV